MKMKAQLSLAAVIMAGLLASGCSQMAAQPTEEVKPTEPAPTVSTDCSKCNTQKPAPAGGAHTHPAIPGCTDSITHTHPYNNANHSHHYSCKGGQRQEKQIDMPQVKAKGNYKGPVQIDTGVMQTYKKQ